MSLTDKINGDIKKAMLAREKDKLEALRAVKSALLLESTKAGGGEITEDDELAILKRLYKQRVESTKIYEEQDREDLASVERFQAEVIGTYLPEQMSEDKVREIVAGVIQKVGASGPGDMGKVMGASMGQLNGKADGGLISKIVRELLAAL
jgi:hypothetical protein